MIADVIKAKLITDISANDSTAAAVLALNPSGTFPSDSAAYVPTCLYQSLQTMWGFASPQDLSDHIITSYGQNLTLADAGIEINETAMRPEYAPLSTEKSDAPATEWAQVKILCRLAPPATTELIQNADLRVRLLIDPEMIANYSASPSNPAQISPLGVDLTIDAQYGIILKWLSFDNSAPGLQRVSVYGCDYRRMFGIFS